MKCPKCGNQLDAGAPFCRVCGALVDRSADSARRASRDDSGRVFVDGRPTPHRAQGAHRASDGASGVGYGAPMRPAFEFPEEKKSKKGLIAGIIAVIAIIAIVLVLLFVWPGFLKGAPSEGGDGAVATSELAGTSTSTSAAASKAFSATAAEKEARKAALDAGKQVFTGTVKVTTWGDRVNEIDPNLAGDFESQAGDTLVLLELDKQLSIEARSSGDMGVLTRRNGGTSLALVDGTSWKDYDGQKVTVAVHAADMWYPSDVTGALYTVTADNAVIIAPLTEKTAEAAIRNAGKLTEATEASIAEAEAAKAEQDAQAEADRQAQEAAAQAEAERQAQAEWEAQQAQQQQATSDGYILPDSASYVYSRSDLDSLSTYDLYLARNEIYARHGRIFKNQDLRDYFGSKSWYSGTVPAESFDTMSMSQVERDNAEAILAIEQERNSPYL